jgi:hypothetical protein
MQSAYQTIYLAVYRWNKQNFGQGSLPKVKSLFNVNFLLVIVLTDLLVFTELIIKKQPLNFDMVSGMLILAGSVLLLLINHLILLNNKWLKKINDRLAAISHHNKNLWSALVLLNVILASFCLIFFIN